MKTKQIWFNLPVKNVDLSKAFYEKIGFDLNQSFDHSQNACSFFIGEQKIVMMLFQEETFKGFVKSGIADLHNGNEVLFSISADNRQEVDEMARLVEEAGGIVFDPPKEIQAWMYGCGFQDIDGHKWNILFMDMLKMPG